MIIKTARKAARQWVVAEGCKLPGFQGAFYHGSINDLPDDAVLPVSSDVDVMVVLAAPLPSEKRGKFLCRNVLLEVSYLPTDQVLSPEQILGNYYLAGSFRKPGIILDPTGRLLALQVVVSRDYAKRLWVRQRCEHAGNNVLNFLQAQNESAPFHDQVMAWLFAAGVTTHILLVAGLKNPTVRRRYVAVKELLAEYHRLDFHETLLEMLGCSRMSRERAEQHLAALAEAFDAAKTVFKTTYRFAADMTDSARPVAIDGSRELIERGLHREAVFWITATYSRCQWVLSHDTPTEIRERFRHGYHHLLADLGIASSADLQIRRTQVREFLPRVRAVSEAIMAANTEIED